MGEVIDGVSELKSCDRCGIVLDVWGLKGETIGFVNKTEKKRIRCPVCKEWLYFEEITEAP